MIGALATVLAVSLAYVLGRATRPPIDQLCSSCGSGKPELCPDCVHCGRCRYNVSACVCRGGPRSFVRGAGEQARGEA